MEILENVNLFIRTKTKRSCSHGNQQMDLLLHNANIISIALVFQEIRRYNCMQMKKHLGGERDDVVHYLLLHGFLPYSRHKEM